MIHSTRKSELSRGMPAETLALNIAIKVAGNVRGAALREFLRWYETAYPGAASEIAETLPRSVFQPGLPAFGVISGRWYEAGDVHLLLDAISARGDAHAIAMEGGRTVMRQTLSGVFRAVTRFLVTKERYASNAHRIWGYYYDHGTFEVENAGPRRSVTTIRDWRAHHGLLCDTNLAAAAVIYETMGCVGTTVERLHCVDDGADRCEYHVRWTKLG